MDARTYPRADVQNWLAGVVCLKVDADREPGLTRKFGVSGFPTLVLLHPSGRTLYKDAGAPAGDQFTLALGYEPYKAMFDASNARDAAGAARNAYFLRRWFAGTRIGKQADEIYESWKKDAAFLRAYEAAAKADAEAVRRAKEAAEAKRREERRRKARAIKTEADALYKKGKRAASYPIYKKLIWEYPETPEADEARKLLKKRRVKWKEPPK